MADDEDEDVQPHFVGGNSDDGANTPPQQSPEQIDPLPKDLKPYLDPGVTPPHGTPIPIVTGPIIHISSGGRLTAPPIPKHHYQPYTLPPVSQNPPVKLPTKPPVDDASPVIIIDDGDTAGGDNTVKFAMLPRDGTVNKR